MPQLPLTHRLQSLVRLDGNWLRCREPNCGDRAYWGKHRPTEWVLVKVQAHRAKVHGAPKPKRAKPPEAAPLDDALVEAAVELARAANDHIGRGVARTVVALGSHHVVKLAGGRMLAPSEGAKHNLAEWRDYHLAEPSVRKYLCPPVRCAPDGAWLIARRAD